MALWVPWKISHTLVWIMFPSRMHFLGSLSLHRGMEEFASHGVMAFLCCYLPLGGMMGDYLMTVMGRETGIHFLFFSFYLL